MFNVRIFVAPCPVDVFGLERFGETVEAWGGESDEVGVVSVEVGGEVFGNGGGGEDEIEWVVNGFSCIAVARWRW